MAIQSIRRAAAILNLFSYQRYALTLSEIAKAMDLPLTTAQGLVGTLVQEGFLRKEADTKRYRLGNKLSILGAVQTATLEINQVGSALVYALARETRLTVRLGIWEEDGVLTTLNAHGRAEATQRYHSGYRMPAYCLSLGKALLAFSRDSFVDEYLDGLQPVRFTKNTLTTREEIEADLKASRERGYAVGNREFAADTAGLAAPIFCADGLVCAALSISGDADEVLSGDRQKLVRGLLNTAADISAALGYYPPQYQTKG